MLRVRVADRRSRRCCGSPRECWQHVAARCTFTRWATAEGRSPVWRAVLSRVWRLADVLIVHTEVERAGPRRRLQDRRGSDPRCQPGCLSDAPDPPRPSHREGCPGSAEGQALLLAIGHLHPHKGFDRAVRAFAELGAGRVRLYVVGSVRREDPVSLGPIEELRRLAKDTPGVELREGYVSDVHFDEWIVALPTWWSFPIVSAFPRTSWSAHYFTRSRVIMSRVGGMIDQGDRSSAGSRSSTGTTSCGRAFAGLSMRCWKALLRTVDEVLATRRAIHTPSDRPAQGAPTTRTSGSGTMNFPPRARNSCSRSRNSSRKCHGRAR